MKPALLFCTIIFACTSFTIPKQVNPKLSLSAFIFVRDSRSMSVKITLTNNSNDTVSYEGWSCSWQRSYLIAPNTWNIIPNLCYKDGHQTYQIPPHQSQSKILYLEKNVSVPTSKDQEFRIGFHYIPPPENIIAMPAAVLHQRLRADSIIWSNTLTTAIIERDFN
jgi:hypothetical protein